MIETRDPLVEKYIRRQERIDFYGRIGYPLSFLVKPWFTRWLASYPLSTPLVQFAEFCRAPFWVVNIFDEWVREAEYCCYLACAVLRLGRLRHRCGDDWYRDSDPFLDSQVLLWKTLARFKNNLKFARDPDQTDLDA